MRASIIVFTLTAVLNASEPPLMTVQRTERSNLSRQLKSLESNNRLIATSSSLQSKTGDDFSTAAQVTPVPVVMPAPTPTPETFAPTPSPENNSSAPSNDNDSHLSNDEGHHGDDIDWDFN